MSAQISELVRRWDDQQAAYIADREKRFDVILDVLELQYAHTPFTVVDLACGPGSLSARILEKFEHASVVGIDYDPMLLELARQSSTRFGDRLQLIGRRSGGSRLAEFGGCAGSGDCVRQPRCTGCNRSSSSRCIGSAANC